jgi:hypothetical protein
MNKELIEKLKDNKVAWKFLSEEEKTCLKEANTKGVVENLKYDGDWECLGEWSSFGRGANEIWRIKPDYQPEPEFEDYEIKLHLAPVYNTARVVEMLCVRIDERTAYQLHELPSLPNFNKFWQYVDGVETKVGRDDVANEIDRGYKVYARMRRDK